MQLDGRPASLTQAPAKIIGQFAQNVICLFHDVTLILLLLSVNLNASRATASGIPVSDPSAPDGLSP
jgi:hypothetical protein